MNWYRLQTRRQTADLWLYSEIGGPGTSALDLLQPLEQLPEKTTLNVRINSPGGDIFEAWALYNALTRHPGRVIAYVDALAASAATVVALAADEIRMASNALWMIHEPWSMIVGTSDDLQRQSDVLNTLARQITELYAKKSGQPVAVIQDWMRAETWFTAEEALQAGFADAIDEPLAVAARATHDLSRFKNLPRGTLMAEPTPVETPEIPELPETPAVPEPVDAPETVESPAEPPAVPEPSEEPPAEPVAIFNACLKAGETTLAGALLRTPHTLAEVQARIAQAQEVRKVCAIAQVPDLADGLIAAGLSAEQAKVQTWDVLAARSRQHPIDNAPPAASAQRLSRADFDRLDPHTAASFVRGGGRVVD